jgi:hypothetical protein
MKAYVDVEIQLPTLNFGTRWRWMLSFKLRQIYLWRRNFVVVEQVSR